MSLAATITRMAKMGKLTQVFGTFAFDNSYPTDGESFSDLLRKVVHLNVHPYKGYTFEPDLTNKKVKAFRTAAHTPAGSLSATATKTAQTFAITDDDNAATTGTALYFHVDEVVEQVGIFGHLESVCAGNADSHFKLGASGPTVRVQDDDDAATGGLAVYFDEDAATVDSRLLVDLDLPGDQDCFIMASDGSCIRCKDTDTPETPGVQVYFDDDAASAHLRLLFVSPTNTAGSMTTDDLVGMQNEAISGTLTGTETAQAALGEVTDTSDLSSLTAVPFEATLWT